MDLAFANRIDTDTESLMILDRTPTGNSLMDTVLERIAGSEATETAYAWIEILSEQEPDRIRERALAGLVERGILEIREKRKLLVFPSRRYVIIDSTSGRDAKIAHHERAVFRPDSRPPGRLHWSVSPMLAASCALSSKPGKSSGSCHASELIRKMDLIGREMIAQLAVWKLGYKRPTPIHNPTASTASGRFRR